MGAEVSVGGLLFQRVAVTVISPEIEPLSPRQQLHEPCLRGAGIGTAAHFGCLL